MKLSRKSIKSELLSLGLNPKTIDKSLDKTERWMRAAYGEANWEELEAETGNAVGTVRGYYEETIKEPEGINTFNRKVRG